MYCCFWSLRIARSGSNPMLIKHFFFCSNQINRLVRQGYDRSTSIRLFCFTSLNNQSEPSSHMKKGDVDA